MVKKTRSPRTTVNVAAVKREVTRMAKETVQATPLSQSMAELPAGAVQRQSPLEQEMVTAKYRGMIHDHNTKKEHILDKLPFTFPKKSKIKTKVNTPILCPECKETCFIGNFTLSIICGRCGKLFSANEGAFKPNVGAFNRAADLLKDD